MIWLQYSGPAVFFSIFGFSFVLLIACITFFLYYVFVSFADGLSAHPKFIAESSIIIFGFFGAANGMIIFRLIGSSFVSFAFHAVIELIITLFVLLQIGLFFNVKSWKLFYYIFPLPAFIMIACFFSECIIALYRVFTSGNLNSLSASLHSGVHAFLGVTTLVVMFWNVTLVLAMMCINPKHHQNISDIDYEDLLLEPAYMAILVLLYMLLVLFMLLIPFLKSQKKAQNATYDVQDNEYYRSINSDALKKSTQTGARLEDYKKKDTRKTKEDGFDADDEQDTDVEDTARSSFMRKKIHKKRRIHFGSTENLPEGRRSQSQDRRTSL